MRIWRRADRLDEAIRSAADQLRTGRPGARAGSAEAELASMPTPGRRTAMRRSERAVEVMAWRTPWILCGMARLAPATGRS